MNRRKVIGISLVLGFLLVLTIAPTEVKALSYTDTAFDFQSWTKDENGVGTLTNGLIQDCEDDLDSTEDWMKTGHTGNVSINRSDKNKYEGTYSANLSLNYDYSATILYGGVSKTFTLPSSDQWDHMWLSVWISGVNSSDSGGYSFIEITSSPWEIYNMKYVLANTTTFSNSFANETTSYGPGGSINGAIRVGDYNDTVFITRNIVSDLYECMGYYISGGTLTIDLTTKNDTIFNVDALLVSFHDTITPLPEPQLTGSAKGFYNESGLCLETGAGESASARIDYTDFGDKWDYGIEVTYSGTGTSTNISSSLNVDAAGWSDWNHTIATLGNDTFMYYTTNQSYSGEDIAGRYVDIDCPASSSIIIQSLTIREGYPSGGGGIGGGGGGIAPITVVTEVVEGFSSIILGIQYWQLLLGGIALAFAGHKYTKKKIHYKVPKQNLVFISGISAILLVFFWFSLSVFYMEAPAETLRELPFEFYIFGFGVGVTVLFGSLPIKMQGIERAPNKLVFKSNDFANSVVKGIILLTSISFVIYYLLNLAFGFTADTFLVTQFQMEIVYAFQLGTTTVWFLHFVLPWIEEIVFRYVTLLIVAPFSDETGRCIFSATVFGAFHYYVARTIGFAYFIYFFAGGLIFYSICYGTTWLEKYWKGMPKLLKFKGAGLLAAIIVHLIFNFMSLYGGSLLQTAWVVEI